MAIKPITRPLCKALLMFFTFCMIGFLIGFSVPQLVGLNRAEKVYKDIKNNWKKNFISDLYVNGVNTDLPCEKGFEDMLIYKFPGFSYGCYCVGSPQRSFYGQCCKSTNEKGCACQGSPMVQVETIKHRDWNVWDSPSDQAEKFGSKEDDIVHNKLRICVKRIPNYNYKEEYKRGIQCGEHEQLCNTAALLINQFCVPKEFKCPVTHISMGSQPPSQQGTYEKVQVIGDTNLYIFRDTDNLPISEFQIEQGDGVCVKYDHRVPNVSEGRERFPLLENGWRDDQCIIDYRYELIKTQDFSIGEEDLYKANGMQEYFKDDWFKQVGIDNKFRYNIYSRKFISFREDCQENFDKFVGLEDRIHFSLGLAIGNVVLSSILAFLFLVVEIFWIYFIRTFMCKAQVDQELNYTSKYYCLSRCAGWFYLVLKYVLMTTIIVISGFCVGTQSSIRKDIGIFYNCVDDSTTDDVLHYMKKRINLGLAIAHLVLVMIACLLEPHILAYFNGKFCQKRAQVPYQNLQDQQQQRNREYRQDNYEMQHQQPQINY